MCNNAESGSTAMNPCKCRALYSLFILMLFLLPVLVDDNKSRSIANCSRRNRRNSPPYVHYFPESLFSTRPRTFAKQIAALFANDARRIRPIMDVIFFGNLRSETASISRQPNTRCRGRSKHEEKREGTERKLRRKGHSCSGSS